MHPGGGRPHSLGTESFIGNKSVSFPHARHKVDSFGSLATTFRERERERGRGRNQEKTEGEFGWPNGKRQTKERSKHSTADLTYARQKVLASLRDGLQVLCASTASLCTRGGRVCRV